MRESKIKEKSRLSEKQKSQIAKMYISRRDEYGLSIIYEEQNLVCKVIESRKISSEIIGYIVQNQKKYFTEVLFIEEYREFTIIYQPRIEINAVISEWPDSSISLAIKKILNLQSDLTNQGLSLEDLHPWNFMLWKGNIYLVDIFSVLPARDTFHWGIAPSYNWGAIDQFWNMYVNLICVRIIEKKIQINLNLQDYYQISTKLVILLLILQPKVLIQYLKCLVMKEIVKQTKPQKKGKKKLKKFTYSTLKMIDKINIKLMKQNSKYKISTDSTTKLNLGDRAESKIVILTGDGNSKYLNLDSLNCKAILVEDRNELNYLDMNFKNKINVFNFNFNSPTPSVGPVNQWSKAALVRFKNPDNIFLIDLEDLFINRKMTFLEIVDTIKNLTTKKAEIYLVGAFKLESSFMSREELCLEFIKYFENVQAVEFKGEIIKMVTKFSV